MVTKQEQTACPVCGKMVSQTGIAGHNKSKFHLDALAKQNAKDEPQEPEDMKIQQTKPKPTTETKIKNTPEVKQTKIESVKTTKLQEAKKEIKQDGEYNGLEWD